MNNKKVVFTLHAEDKLKRLMKMGVTKEKVLKIIENPVKVVNGYYGRKIAQGLLSEDLILRIVYEESEGESEGEIVVVTRLCILSISQNASCDFIIYPSHWVQPHTLYPVCHEAFGIACDTGYLLRRCAGSPAIATTPPLSPPLVMLLEHI